MRVIRYIYPHHGRISIENIAFRPSDDEVILTECRKNRIEIYNLQGDLVRVIASRKEIRQLKLQKGFYLLRETDFSGRIINNSKLVL
jgi:hypothetical protein